MGKRIGVFLVRAYRWERRHMFGWVPAMCRFEPTCSRYTMEAIEKYGLIKGSWLGFKRIMRCHPYSKGGHDPVP